MGPVAPRMRRARPDDGVMGRRPIGTPAMAPAPSVKREQLTAQSNGGCHIDPCRCGDTLVAVYTVASNPIPSEFPDLPAWLQQLVETHKGKLTSIATDLGCSRAYAGRLVRAHGFEDRAAELRREAGVTGPRKPLERAAKQVARAALVKAIATAGSDEAARAVLGMPRRSFYRRKAQLKITQQTVARFVDRSRKAVQK